MRTCLGSASDSGILIDSVSTDKYEASLHKDARFWESIATRKTRGKKRRPRKFVSAQQEQFSISDDAGTTGKGSDSPNTNEISFLSSQAALLQQKQKGMIYIHYQCCVFFIYIRHHDLLVSMWSLNINSRLSLST